MDIPPSQVNIPNGNAEDLVAECKAYEDRIKSFGGIELFLGGTGSDGHIAFNVSSVLLIVLFTCSAFPLRSLVHTTHVITMTLQTNGFRAI